MGVERIKKRGAGKPPLHNGGFTLVEVLAALAILGGALFILLNTHYSALRLHEEMASAVLRRELMERVVSDAEFKVLTGTLTEAGEFEGRYAGYSWSFNGTPTGGTEEMPIPFYQVVATLRTPEGEEETLNFYVFDISSNEVLAEGTTQ
jgi:prepilin-type N-terminal cleavage/methylation domain-containing protein